MCAVFSSVQGVSFREIYSCRVLRLEAVFQFSDIIDFLGISILKFAKANRKALLCTKDVRRNSRTQLLVQKNHTFVALDPELIHYKKDILLFS